MEYIISHFAVIAALVLSLISLGMITLAFYKLRNDIDVIDSFVADRLAKHGDKISSVESNVQSFHSDFIRHNDDFRAKLGSWKDNTVKRIEKLESFKSTLEKAHARKKNNFKANNKGKVYNKNTNYKPKNTEGEVKSYEAPKKQYNKPYTRTPYKKPTYQVDKNGFRKMN